MDGGGGSGGEEGVEVGSKNDKKWWLSKMGDATENKLKINSGLDLTTNQSGEVDDVRSNTEYIRVLCRIWTILQD